MELRPPREVAAKLEQRDCRVRHLMMLAFPVFDFLSLCSQWDAPLHHRDFLHRSKPDTDDWYFKNNEKYSSFPSNVWNLNAKSSERISLCENMSERIFWYFCYIIFLILISHSQWYYCVIISTKFYTQNNFYNVTEKRWGKKNNWFHKM